MSKPKKPSNHSDLEAPQLIRASRRYPITKVQMQKMRDTIVGVLERGPQNTRFFTEKFGLTKSAMSKHMRNMEAMGLIYCVQKRRVDARIPFEWHIGQSPEPVVLAQDEDEDDGCGLPKRVLKRSWPPLDIAQQNPWSALGL